MIELGPATEDEMVLTFLRGERDSPRFGFGEVARDLLEPGDPTNATENATRRNLLSLSRGFGRGLYLFRGFPTDTTWRRVQLEASDLTRLRYARHSTWIDLTRGSLRVEDGAPNIGKGMAAEDVDVNVPAVAERVRAGDRFEDMIAVEGEGSDIILVEGHVRATAYLLAGHLDGATLLLGSSPAISSWGFF